MYGPLLVNILIIVTIVVGLVLTGNPLFVLCLFWLQGMPFLMPDKDQDQEQEEEQPMGFTARID